MKIRRYDGSDVRLVLAGMVTDPTVCSRIAGQWRKPGLFAESYANLVGQWCVEHLERYGTVPNGELRAVYEEWASRPNVDEKTAKLVERFLHDASDEHGRRDRPPSDYVLDKAGRLFNKARMREAIEAAADDLDYNRTDDAYARLVGLASVELGAGSTVKLAEDYDAWRRAFDPERLESLIVYPGALDAFLGRWLTRDSLYAFMASDKSFKSFWLLDLAYRAVRKTRCRVAYFDAGDHIQDEVVLRLAQRATRRPLEPEAVKWPTDMMVRDGHVRLKLERRRHDRPLTPGEAYEAFRRICRGRDAMRLSCHPNRTLSVAGISGIVRDWQRTGWTPDVICVDYADILAPPSGVRDRLDQIEETWGQLRRLSQETHSLVVTCTQANAEAYRGRHRVLGRRHFGGRKTKLADVNGLIALNVSDEDRPRSVTWVNWVVRRRGSVSEGYAVPVAGCLAVGCPVVRTLEKSEDSGPESGG